MKNQSRRNFLKGGLKLGAAAAAVTAVATVPQQLSKREPKPGEEFYIWSNKDDVCEHCGVGGISLSNVRAVLGATETRDGKPVQVFLIQDRIFCPHCHQRVGKYLAPSVKYTERVNHNDRRSTST